MMGVCINILKEGRGMEEGRVREKRDRGREEGRKRERERERELFHLSPLLFSRTGGRCG